MNVLSLFDGMSCGQIALDQLGVKVEKYYASEIDKYAIQVTQKNYPSTIQLGDITKWREWDIDWASIDLVFGGSPCQGFSFAGKQLAFNDPRSKLFFIFVDILEYIKLRRKLADKPEPKFLLENVRMKKEHLQVISNHLGVLPVMINSALVSAQNRVRFYWTNIGDIEQPEDRGILLKDIIENGEVDREKSLVVTTRVAGATAKRYKEKSLHQMVIVDSLYNNRPARVYKEKSPTIRSGRTGLIVTGGAIRGRYNGDGKTEQKLEVQHTGRANSITTVQKDSLCIQVGEADLKGHDSIKRVYSHDGKSPTLTTMGGGHREPKIAQPELTWRKLTPLECERLQTVPDGYTEGVSNTQRYRMLGNGWTVEVIKHIFKDL